MSCLELAIETCSCNLCGAAILCKPCMDKIKASPKGDCPICRQPAACLSINMALKRIVQNLSIECDNQCGVKHTVAEANQHKKVCKNRLIECNTCAIKV